MSRNFEHSADDLNGNAGSPNTLYGISLPQHDSLVAIARDMGAVEERLDAILAKIEKVLGN